MSSESEPNERKLSVCEAEFTLRDTAFQST